MFQVHVQSLSFLASILPNACRADYVLIDLNAGNLPEIFQSQAGVPDFKYQQDYGDVVRIKGPFGVWQTIIFPILKVCYSSGIQEDRLLLSDPKALQYIFHTSGRYTSGSSNDSPDMCTCYRVWFFEMA